MLIIPPTGRSSAAPSSFLVRLLSAVGGGSSSFHLCLVIVGGGFAGTGAGAAQFRGGHPEIFSHQGIRDLVGFRTCCNIDPPVGSKRFQAVGHASTIRQAVASLQMFNAFTQRPHIV